MSSNANGSTDIVSGGQLRRYDLLLKNGRIFDPSQKLDRVADVGIIDGKIAAIESNIDVTRARRNINVEGLLVCPGLIDLHVHCNMFRSPEALDSTATGVASGVTRIVDPGDSGAYNFNAFRKNVVEKSLTKIHSWLSVAGLGGFMFGLYNTDINLHPNMIDVDAAIACAKMYPEIIRGFKMYGAPEGWGTHDGTEVYRKALEIATGSGLPLYVHSGAPAGDDNVVYGAHPVLYGELTTRENALTKILELMRPGDLVAHVFSTFSGTVWNWNESRMAHGAKEAYDRGILFDTGRGAHFSYTAIRNLLERGFVPHTISTDRHASDQFDQFNRVSSAGMCLHMSELMVFGMSLADVILRASWYPAKALRLTHEAGSLKIGYPADIAVLALREGNWTFRDNPYAAGKPEAIRAKQLLTPVITLLDGKVCPANPGLLPDLHDLQTQEDVWSWMGDRPDRPWAYGLDEFDHKPRPIDGDTPPIGGKPGAHETSDEQPRGRSVVAVPGHAPLAAPTTNASHSTESGLGATDAGRVEARAIQASIGSNNKFTER